MKDINIRTQSEEKTSEEGLFDDPKIVELMIEIATWGAMIFIFVL